MLVKPKHVGTHTQILSPSMCLFLSFFKRTSSSSLKSKFITNPALWSRDCLCPWLPTLVDSTIVILFFYDNVMCNIIWSAMRIIYSWMTVIANILWLYMTCCLSQKVSTAKAERIPDAYFVHSFGLLCTLSDFSSLSEHTLHSLFTHSQWKFRLITMYIHFIVLHYFFRLK